MDVSFHPSIHPTYPTPFPDQQKIDAHKVKIEAQPKLQQPLPDSHNVPTAMPVQTQRQLHNDMIAHLLRAKQSPQMDDRVRLLENPPPLDVLGTETWMIGLIGMAIDLSNVDPIFLRSLAYQILDLLPRQQTPFIADAAIRALQTRLPELPADMQQEIRQLVTTLDKTRMAEVNPLAHSLEDPVQSPPVHNPLAGSASTQQQAWAASAAGVAMLHPPTQIVHDDQDASQTALAICLLGYLSMAESKHDVPVKVVGILLHPAVSLPEKLQDLALIQVLSEQVSDWQTDFKKKIQRLLRYKCKTVYVLMPDAEVWKEWEFVDSLVDAYPRTQLKLVDTQTVGIGLGFVVEQIAHFLFDGAPVADLGFMIGQASTHVRAWTIVQNASLGDQSWYQRLTAHTPQRMAKYGLIRLSQSCEFESGHASISGALEELIEKIRERCTESHDVSQKMVIEHAHCPKEAAYLLQLIQKIAPHVAIVVRQAPAYLEKICGQHVSVGII